MSELLNTWITNGWHLNRASVALDGPSWVARPKNRAAAPPSDGYHP